MPKIQEGTKEKHRGKGEGASYKPWILTREFNSIGTTANIIDWKNKRPIQLLSDGEKMLYYILRWNDEVADIREQFPLNLESTLRICRALGIKHPKDNKTHMTTDMLVTLADGRYRAYSLKSDRKVVFSDDIRDKKKLAKIRRINEKLAVEKFYWQEQGIEWRLVFKEELNIDYAENIRRVVMYYDENSVHDEISKIKHLIAIKKINVDMKNGLLDFKKIADQYRNEVFE